MNYTNIPKPNTPTYTNQNFPGKQQYNESSVTYDDSTVYYDGANQSLYTNISKPVVPSYTNISKPT